MTALRPIHSITVWSRLANDRPTTDSVPGVAPCVGLLHGFMKETQKTRTEDLGLARKTTQIPFGNDKQES
jgi:hypothetical protein